MRLQEEYHLKEIDEKFEAIFVSIRVAVVCGSPIAINMMSK